MRSRAHILLLILVACLLTACTTHRTAHSKEPPKWKSALTAAIRSDDVDRVAQVLAEYSLSPDVAWNDNSVTPLMIASSLGSRRVVEWLLDQGAKVNACTTLKDPSQYPEAAGCTPLFMACGRGRLGIARLLVEHAADVNQQDDRGNTPLIIACGRGHLDTAIFLIEHGANLNYVDPHGATPLLRAIQQDQPLVAECLIARGADVNAAFANGRNTLAVAAERGDVSLVELLIEKGASLSQAGGRPLLDAAAEGHAEVVSLLVQKGIPLDVQDEEGFSALMKAAGWGHADTVQVLCKAGADPTKRNVFGRTALDYARGIPGTDGLKTTNDFSDAVEKGLFDQRETWLVVARRAAGSGPSYDRIIKTLEEHEKRFRSKSNAGAGG